MRRMFNAASDIFNSISDFNEEFRYRQAQIRMSDPKFFGVTEKEADEYKRILAEHEGKFYDPYEDVVMDVDYHEVKEPGMVDLSTKVKPEVDKLIKKLGNMPPYDQLPEVSNRRKRRLERQSRKDRLYGNL